MSIQHRRLGQHGVLVSNLCLGTINFGWHTSKADSFAIMDRALELGINFFDTAKNALQALDEIFPGPGGEAPTAYDW